MTQPHDSIKVFVIDDDAGDRRLIRDSLDDAFEIVGESGYMFEAFESIPGAEPDVIVLDERLLFVKGHVVVPLLRERFPAARVVGFTGTADPEVLREAGADASLAKDDIDRLGTCLREVVGRPDPSGAG